MSRADSDHTGASLPSIGEEDRRELERLREIDREYRVTLQVLAVLTERYLQASGQAAVIISDLDLADQPDLIAHRDDARRIVSLTVTR